MRNLMTFLVFFSFAAWSTTFVPVTIKKQVEESEAVVEGEVVDISAEESGSGMVVSKVFLRADKWLGIQPEAYHTELFFPGGVVGEKAFQVDGAPKFKIGERVVVFLNKSKGKNWVQNLGLGKFSIKKVGTQEVIVNQIFPNLPDVGQMTIKSFYGLVERIKDKKLKIRFKDKYERSFEKQSFNTTVKKFNGRRVASVSPLHETKDDSKFGVVWLVIIFGFLGALFTFLKRNRSV